jgi:cation transport ATPase
VRAIEDAKYEARMRHEARRAAAACVLSAPLLAPLLGLALPGWIELVLAGVVQFVIGARFYAGAWKALRTLTSSVDLLVALGTSGAFGLSVYRLVAGPPGAHLYFDVSAVVIALTVIGKWLEPRTKRPPAAAAPRPVDRVIAWFVPCVVLVALGALAGWWLFGGDLATGVVTAVSVLVMCCPCALGLATPTALRVGAGAAARAGILVRDAEALERAHRLDTLVLDIAIAEPLKPTARAAVERLHALGIETVVLAGDKEAEVRRLQAEGRIVGMVGDSVDDVPALAAADVGVAMGSGADVAMQTAGITLLRSDPRLIADAVAVSRATYEKIRQGLFWAFVYNVVGLPAAALGMLSPSVVDGAMALSLVSVVCNTLRLKGWKPAVRRDGVHTRAP